MPLSYIDTRSVFTHEERYAQTIETIKSVRSKIPNSIICLVECSKFTDDQHEYISSLVDHFINLFDNTELRSKIYGKSKSLGEGTMTIAALQYILSNKLDYTSLYKISGRYWLSESFSLDDANLNIVKPIDGNQSNISTALYKINRPTSEKFLDFLKSKQTDMEGCRGYEVMFAEFISGLKDVKFVDIIGVAGYVSVDTDKHLYLG